MSNTMTKVQDYELDGFAGYEDRVEGDDRQQGGNVIQGALVKFTNEATWLTRDGDELPADRELIVVDIARLVQRWKDQQPVETRILAPGEKFPDVADLNEAVPRTDWVKGPDGKPRGPWQAQHVVYMLDPATMERYSFPTGTVGGAIAVRDLVDKTNWMRRYRGGHVYPAITLSDTFMNTRFGGRQRPHFLIKRWVKLDAESGERALPAPALEDPVRTRLDQFAANENKSKAETKTATVLASPAPEAPGTPTQAGAQEVDPPSLREELNDDLPF